jgi:hypothetical protein
MISLPPLHLVCLPLAFSLSLRAATFEVAQQNPQASDEAPGSAARPWKTITKAAEMVGPGDSVVIRGGVYRERVLVKTSGTGQAPIRFEAAPGEQVVVTGADRLSGWRKADDARPIYRVAWPHRFIGWNRSMTHPDAVLLAGRHNGMEDCVVESMNASGATFTGEDAVVRRCVFRDNGQLGFGASRAHRLLFTECLVENNNTKGFDRGWGGRFAGMALRFLLVRLHGCA